jgi:hypothetical protein
MNIKICFDKPQDKVIPLAPLHVVMSVEHPVRQVVQLACQMALSCTLDLIAECSSRTTE